MLEFFNDIFGYFNIFWQFLQNIIESITMSIVMLTQTLTFPLQLVGYMPAIIGTSITMVVAIATVKFIIGR